MKTMSRARFNPAAARRSRLLGLFCLIMVLSLPAVLLADQPTFVRMETTEGNILLTFYPELAPYHVGNFLHLARTGFFNGTCFHRIVPGFFGFLA